VKKLLNKVNHGGQLWAECRGPLLEDIGFGIVSPRRGVGLLGGFTNTSDDPRAGACCFTRGVCQQTSREGREGE